MELNIVVLCGRVATEPEVRSFDSGATLIRYLVTVRSDTPRRRVDVIPVTLWDPTPEDRAAAVTAHGRVVWVAGSVQRRFWTGGDGRASRLEVVAHHVEVRDPVEVGVPSGTLP